MKTKAVASIIIILVACNILLLTTSFKTRKKVLENNVEVAHEKDNVINLSYDVAELTKYDSLQFQSDDYQVDVNLPLRDLKGNLTTLKKLLSTGPKLVFRYSELNCNVCYQKVLDELSVLIKKIGSKNVLIVTSYSNQRELYNFMRINNIEDNVFNISDQTLGLPVEQFDLPFLFMLDNSFRTRTLFIPYKKNPAMTKEYFLSVKNRYFNNEISTDGHL